ncbi:MAG TPA: hypothetical protein VG754_12070 [Verrucomicrobiae bacterium]|jgi:anti-sigma factor RsiW|nr:hypothetical protein [Verrucomicrobiae bacterium]
MNHDSQLKLQAFLDGELSGHELAEARDLLARDAEAQALLTELRNTEAALAGNEPECQLPESREFFWSKIEREIERESEQPARPVAAQSWFAWIQRHFLPVGTFALVCVLLGFVAVHSRGPGNQLGEIEVASDDMGSYTYRDQANKMTMVWLYDRNNTDSTVADSSDIDNVTPE